MTGWRGLAHLAFRNLFRNGRRSAFALGTVAAGGAGLFIFMGFNRGIMNQYRANTIRARWGHGILTTPGYRNQAYAEPWKRWIPAPGRALAAVRALPGVRGVYPRAGINALLVAGSISIAAQGEGVDGPAEAAFFDQLNFVAGRDFGPAADGLVLGRGLAEGLGVRPGSRLTVVTRDTAGRPRSAPVTVSGVFHTGSQDYDSRAFRMPLALAGRLLGTDRVESIAVALDSVEAWPAFAAGARAARPDLEPIPFDELDRVYYGHAVNWLDAQFVFIRGIIVLVVLLGIFNLISMAAVERTAEVGMLRANGESRGEIAAGQLLESAALGLLGGLLGVAAGLALVAGPLHAGIAMPPAPGITRSFRIAIELAGDDAWRVIVLCGVTATAGAVLPVWRATRMPIAEALRRA